MNHVVSDISSNYNFFAEDIIMYFYRGKDNFVSCQNNVSSDEINKNNLFYLASQDASVSRHHVVSI